MRQTPAVLFPLLALLALFLLTPQCVTVIDGPPIDGSQGQRIWYGKTLKSFEHGGANVCVPGGWEAVGAIVSGSGHARFAEGMTATLIRSDAFASRRIETGTSYEVTLRYPAGTPEPYARRYAELSAYAFKTVGTLYGDITETPSKHHTVLVTAGVAGSTKSPDSRVYPDPGPDVTMLVRTPDQTRSEELLIHAVAHLYNRFGADDGEYLSHQEPIPGSDFEEVEAAWTELAYSSKVARAYRVTYLYNIHTAVRTRNYSRIEEPPFNDEEAFLAIAPSAFVPPGSAYLDYQYGHYVLAPLSMAALEGLLQRQGAGTDVARLLTHVHKEDVSLLSLVQEALSEEDAARFLSWLTGEETVPEDLVRAGQSYYDLRAF